MCKLFHNLQNSAQQRFVFQSENPGERPMMAEAPEEENEVLALFRSKRETMKLVALLEREIAKPKIPARAKEAKKKRLKIAEKKLAEITERLAELRDDEVDEPKIILETREAKARGTLHVPSLPELEPAAEDSIDPGQPDPAVKLGENPPQRIFPALKSVADRLEKIGDEEFWDKNPSALKVTPELAPIVNNIKRAFIYKAIAENWTAKTLYAEYRKAMKILYDQVADRTITYEVIGKLYRALRFVLPEAEDKGLPGKNRFLLDREIKPGREKGEMRIKLDAEKNRIKLSVFKDFYEINDDSEMELDEDKVDIDKVESAEESTIPFYTELLLNSAIVEGWNKDTLVKKYTDIVSTIYSQCLKNTTEAEQRARARKAEKDKKKAEEEKEKEKEDEEADKKKQAEKRKEKKERKDRIREGKGTTLDHIRDFADW